MMDDLARKDHIRLVRGRRLLEDGFRTLLLRWVPLGGDDELICTDEARIGRDEVAGLQEQEVARHDIVVADLDALAPAAHTYVAGARQARLGPDRPPGRRAHVGDEHERQHEGYAKALQQQRAHNRESQRGRLGSLQRVDEAAGRVLLGRQFEHVEAQGFLARLYVLGMQSFGQVHTVRLRHRLDGAGPRFLGGTVYLLRCKGRVGHGAGGACKRGGRGKGIPLSYTRRPIRRGRKRYR